MQASLYHGLEALMKPMPPFFLSFAIAFVIARSVFYWAGIERASWGAPALLWARDFGVWTASWLVAVFLARWLWQAWRAKARPATSDVQHTDPSSK
jgi:hypothetical protein